MLKAWLYKSYTKIIPWSLFTIALGYYYSLSSKIFTWVYTSGDAGDWLTLTNWWYVPHTCGKPLLILYIKGLSYLPGEDVNKLTFFMSVLPAAITIVLTYLIARHYTQSIRLAIIASLVLLGAVVFLTQATVLEQYALLAMFITLAYYLTIIKKHTLAVVCLGITTGMHVVGLPLALIWFLTTKEHREQWKKLIPLYIVTGIVPYTMILAMMADPTTPKLLAGDLSWASLNEYLGNPTSMGMLALTEAPERLWRFLQVTIISLGVAVVPLFKGITWKDKTAVILIGFLCWFYITNWFPSVFKWLVMILPIVCVYAVIGLQKMTVVHTRLVVISAVVLIGVNGIFMNTDKIAHENPEATEYVQALEQLPDGSAVITPRGGQYGFALFYVISEGKDLIPLAKQYPFGENGELNTGDIEQYGGYLEYLAWLEREYGITGRNMFDIVEDALTNGYTIYHGEPESMVWKELLILENTTKPYLKQVYGLNYNPDLGKIGIITDD